MIFGEYILKKLLKISVIGFFLCMASASWAEEYMLSSGTGFFITRYGHIITAAHVVNDCQAIGVRGAVSPTEAKLMAIDNAKDLAILKADVYPPNVASLMNNNGYMDRGPLKVGDFVMVIGYPLEHGKTGIYKVEKARITGLRGPSNEPEWIQFSDSAQQGNSGGPLLDISGNVAGVVVGKSRLVRRNPDTQQEEIVSQSDVAVTLSVLKKFLGQHKIQFNRTQSVGYFSHRHIENQATRYLVNVHCLKTSGTEATKGEAFQQQR